MNWHRGLLNAQGGQTNRSSMPSINKRKELDIGTVPTLNKYNVGTEED